MKNTRLNNISSFEKITELSNICPICDSKMYVIENFMYVEYDSNQIEYCENDDTHIFERECRGSGFYQIDKRGNIIQKIS
jgi:hypothetical protein